MAGAGAKKRLEENKGKLQQFQLLLLSGLVCYAGLRMWFFKGYQSGWHWTGFALTSLVNLISFSLLKARAAPTYGANGELEVRHLPYASVHAAASADNADALSLPCSLQAR